MPAEVQELLRKYPHGAGADHDLRTYPILRKCIAEKMQSDQSVVRDLMQQYLEGPHEKEAFANGRRARESSTAAAHPAQPGDHVTPSSPRPGDTIPPAGHRPGNDLPFRGQRENMAPPMVKPVDDTGPKTLKSPELDPNVKPSESAEPVTPDAPTRRRPQLLPDGVDPVPPTLRRPPSQVDVGELPKQDVPAPQPVPAGEATGSGTREHSSDHELDLCIFQGSTCLVTEWSDGCAAGGNIADGGASFDYSGSWHNFVELTRSLRQSTALTKSYRNCRLKNWNR